MPKHVTMAGGRVELANVQTAPEFRVTDDKDGVAGDLRVSRGGAFWRSKGATKYRHLTWEQLAAAFAREGDERSVGEYNWSPPEPPTFDEW